MTHLWTRYESDFRMAFRLQAELNNQTLCGGSTVDWVTSHEGNEESNYCGMFVAGQGWKASTPEPGSSAERRKSGECSSTTSKK